MTQEEASQLLTMLTSSNLEDIKLGINIARNMAQITPMEDMFNVIDVALELAETAHKGCDWRQRDEKIKEKDRMATIRREMWDWYRQKRKGDATKRDGTGEPEEDVVKPF
jgi:hypothetical protein